MKLIILAAGEGLRLKNISHSKPLTRLFGLTLLERAVLTAEKAGISDICIVVGHNSDEITRFVKNKGIKAEVIFNPNWKKGNGTSVYAAKNFVKDEEQFLIAMADHIADVSVLEKIVSADMEDYSLLLAVDTEPGDHIDLEDATKVLYDPQNFGIIKAGKNLREFNAIDTGFFKCKQKIFDAIEQTEEDGSLTAAVNYLAQKNEASVLPVSGSFWIDVDTPEALNNAKKLLLQNLTKKTDGPISRLINRKISVHVSAWLSQTNITPNQISFFSFLLSLISSVAFSFGSWTASAAGGILAQISSIIDGCDGEVARLKFQESSFGAWFDAVLDRLADGMLISGISFGLLKSGFEPETVFLVFAFSLIGSYLLSYTADKYDFLIKKGLVGSLRIGRDLRLFIIFLAGLLNKTLLALAILGAISFVETFRRIWLAKKFWR